jgi:hypothetical protein
MTLATSPWQFVLRPAVDPTPYAAEIDATVGAFRTFLDTAVAEQPNYAALLVEDGLFCQSSDSLAERLGVLGADNLGFIKQAWRFNLASLGLAAAGITTSAVWGQLDVLERHTTLASQLAYPVTMPQDRAVAAELNRRVGLAIDSVFQQFWWLLSETTRDGVRVDSGEVQMRHANDYSYGAHLMFETLHRHHPLSGAKDKLDGFNMWRFNIYRLALQMLGYQPAN